VAVSSALAALNTAIGVLADSTSALAVGIEFAGDVLASVAVLVGLGVAARPPDANHPYGHGRIETVSGLIVGFILVTGGIGIGYRSILHASVVHSPGAAALWVLALSVLTRGVMSAFKFRLGRGIGSTSLVADAWNDAVDVLSAGLAFAAVSLARLDPSRFGIADHVGGTVVGAIVVMTGLRVVRRASLELADTMPDPALTAELRRAAMSVPGVRGVEKQLARKTGLRYHVDVHLEVDPDMTVRASHEIAHAVKRRVLAECNWVADVLVHVEPAPDTNLR